MSKAGTGSVVLTAHDLLTGRAVYRTADGRWSERHSDARVFSDADGASAVAEAAADAHLVSGPYLAGVVAGASASAPARYREAVRALGPTMRRDLGKQADGTGLTADERAALSADARAVVLGALARD